MSQQMDIVGDISASDSRGTVGGGYVRKVTAEGHWNVKRLPHEYDGAQMYRNHVGSYIYL